MLGLPNVNIVCLYVRVYLGLSDYESAVCVCVCLCSDKIAKKRSRSSLSEGRNIDLQE